MLLPLPLLPATPSPMHLQHNLFLFFLLVLLNLFFFFFFFITTTCSASSTNSEVAFLSSWLSASPARPPDWSPSSPSPCNWSHITCSDADAVTGVTFQSVHLAVPLPAGLCAALPWLFSFVVSDSNLTGAVPDDLSLCRRLATLDLSANSLSGEIPASLANATALESLILNSNQLTGPIPPALGESELLAASLKELFLFDNRLSGELPPSLGRLRLLESLRLGGNRELSGEIPDSLSSLSSLAVLGLADTKISGQIPPSIGKLRSLATLSIYTTSLSGPIPPELGDCGNLTDVYLYENSLSGPIPPELGKLGKLQKLLLWQNSLTGPIPSSFGALSSLVSLDLSINSISGAIPPELGRLPALQDLMLSDNNLTGGIPAALANATALVQLQLDTNEISGLIPPELGRNLINLQVLFAWQNRLEGKIPQELAAMASLQALDLSHNRLTGPIPPGLFLLKNLTKLLLLSNDLSGVIPPDIGKAERLVRLRLAGNRIAGSIPRAVAGMKSVVFLDLGSNNLAGSIPNEISLCSQLQMLDLSNNTLTGSLPESLAQVRGLQELDVSHNKLTGALPDSFGKLESLSRLVLAGNALSGPIPAALGRCGALELLDLSDNGFSGGIPDELCNLDELDIALNLSRNALTGMIPGKISQLSKLSVLDVSYNALGGGLMPLAGLENLVTLNVSHNNFTGYLPDTKLFRQLSPGSLLAGNAGLCTTGGDVCFRRNAGDGDGEEGDEARVHRLKLAIALLVTATVAMVVAMIGILRARQRSMAGKGRGHGSGSESEGGGGWPWQFTPFQKVSFSVEQVVRSLVDANVIGKGVHGVVYRVCLDSGETIAVKKLWPATAGANIIGKDDVGRDSFSAEVRTLGTIRHKNIVRFLGCCWNRSTRLLMYDYMPNGSLGAVLHERGSNGGHGGGGAQLEWDVRYRIVLGSAQGLAYLHHDCSPAIVHRDIKANNILIGLDFEPYIADFGLAKLVDDDANFGRSSNTVAGSYGYIAPEYGYMMKITEKSDVYSYGVVVLEVLTGKQPIDPTIPDGQHVVDWVRRHKGSATVLDLALRGRSDTEVEEMLQVMGVALLCVSPTPDDRPTMKDVAALLKEIRLEHEEYAKVDVLLLKGGGCGGRLPTDAPMAMPATTLTSSTPPCRQGPGSSSNSSSFSAIYSSSKAKSTFG